MAHEPDERPRVVMVAHDVHRRGGMERVTYEVVERLASRYRITVVSCTIDDDLLPLVEWRRVRAPSRPFPLKFVVFWVVAGRALRSAVGLRHTLGAIVPNRADVASVHFLHAAYRRPSGDATPARRLNNAVTRLLSLAAERWCYRPSRLGALAAVSDGVARECRANYPGVPVHVTPNGVDLDRFRPDGASRDAVRRRIGSAGADALVVLFVGGDWGRKGLQVLATALERVDGAELWVAGPGDPREITSTAHDRIRFLGRRDDVHALCSAADVFALPSDYEAAPLVVYEAAASGLPLLVTDVNGAGDLVRTAGCGRVLPREPRAFAEALVELQRDPDLRRRWGAAARDGVSALTWDASADATADVYTRVGVSHGA